MLKDKGDEFYGARLVATARLHLPSVMGRQVSPFFFEVINEIVEKGVYRGYRNIKGKQVRLSGIKDFLHNFHYGLGIKDLAEFVSCCVYCELRDTSKQRHARRFIDWLKKEDPKSFQFPPHYWEYRRLLGSVARMKSFSDRRKRYCAMMKTIYDTHPEILANIGPGRKYQSIPEAYEKEGYLVKPKSIGSIKLSSSPTYKEVEKLARELNSRLDKLKNRVLIAKLIEIYKINEAIEGHVVIHSSEGSDE